MLFVMVMVFVYPVPELKFKLRQTAVVILTVQLGERLSNIASVAAVGIAPVSQLPGVPQSPVPAPFLQIGITIQL
jgi:hypothetical protein